MRVSPLRLRCANPPVEMTAFLNVVRMIVEREPCAGLAIGLGDGEEENWRARGCQRRMLDGGAARGGCRGEYVSVFQLEPADVEDLSGETGRGVEDARGAREARCESDCDSCELSN